MSVPAETATKTSRKAYAVRAIEEMILSGRLSIGQPIPPERELALTLGVSRPVVHEAMVELAAAGLVLVIPRQGSVVNDFRSTGSLSLFASIVQYAEGPVERELLEGMFSIRELLESEAAGSAAERGTEEQFGRIRRIIADETAAGPADVELLVALDFSFHHAVAAASGNILLPLFMNTFKPIYTNLSRQFYRDLDDPSEVTDFHVSLAAAMEARDRAAAERTMRMMLRHGAGALRHAAGDVHA